MKEVLMAKVDPRYLSIPVNILPVCMVSLSFFLFKEISVRS